MQVKEIKVFPSDPTWFWLPLTELYSQLVKTHFLIGSIRLFLPVSFPEADKKTLSSQSFWNHMIELNQDNVNSIEDEITKRIVEKYVISNDCLLFENTNFLTYMDTSNPATIPQWSHSKEKRTALKIIGDSLMVGPKCDIPLFHETYPDNRSDSNQFLNIIDKLKHSLSKINANNSDMSLVFDKRNNSEHIIELFENESMTKINFIGGLR
jgi:transposase